MTHKSKPPGAGIPQAAATQTSRSPAANSPSQNDSQVSDRRDTPAPPTIPAQLVKIAEEFGQDFAGDIVLVARLLAVHPTRATLARLGMSPRDMAWREGLSKLVGQPEARS